MAIELRIVVDTGVAQAPSEQPRLPQRLERRIVRQGFAIQSSGAAEGIGRASKS